MNTNRKKMKIVQCWDDGVTTDIQVVNILRRHGAKATFNLNAGLHETKRKFSWVFKNTEVWKLGWNEMRSVYEGFTIANHSLTHPHLTKISMNDARENIIVGRDKLQQFFQQPILGFSYPFGSYDRNVMKLVADAGHIYARTTQYAENPLPVEDPMAFHSCCHFLDPDFWVKFEKARLGGVFYFWGHSYELISEAMFNEFEKMIVRINSQQDVCWAELESLF